MSSCQVSVVIPSYRRGERILPCLRSVIDQTRRPSEVIVVNDGGFSETNRAVAALSSEVRVVDVAHGGAALARNAGVRAATGDVVVLFDDDDVMKPNAVEVLVGAMERLPQAVASFADHTFTDMKTGYKLDNHFHSMEKYGRLWRQAPLAVSGDSRLYGRGAYEALLHGNLFGQPWAVRRDVYLDLGGFRAGFGSADDWELYLRLTRRYKIAVSDRLVSDHYQETGRQHLTTGSGQEAKQAAAIEAHLKEVGWRECRVRAVLRRRLAGYWKAWGDASDCRKGRSRCYLKAAWLWPFDHVVLARALCGLPWALSVSREGLSQREPTAPTGHSS